MRNFAIAVVLVLMGALAALMYYTAGLQEQLQAEQSKVDALYYESDSLRTVAGEHELQLSTLQMSARQLRRLHASRTDSLLLVMQDIEKKAKGRVTVATVYVTSTKTSLSGETSVTGRKTTENDTIPAAVYTATLRDSLNVVKMYMDPDSSAAECRHFDRVAVWHEYRNPLFRRPEVTTHIRHSNPNVASLDGRSYQEPGPRQRRGLWFAAGVVAAAVAKSLLL